MNNNNAANANGVVPDCENSQIRVAERPKQSISRKERPSCLERANEKRMTPAACGPVRL